jgi:hypothetical protein
MAIAVCREVMYPGGDKVQALEASVRAVWRSRPAADAARAAYTSLCSDGWPSTCAAEMVLTAVTSYHARRSDAALEQSVGVAAGILSALTSSRLTLLGANVIPLTPHTFHVDSQGRCKYPEYWDHVKQQFWQQSSQLFPTPASQHCTMACAVLAFLRDSPGTTYALRQVEAGHDKSHKR